MSTEWNSALHQSVFLADKILELMGGYVVFRRSIYVGECEDYKNIPFEEAMFTHWSTRLEKWPPEKFPKIFRKLVEQRYEFPIIFFEAFKKGVEWAKNLAKQAYENGKVHESSLEDFIKNFKPKSEEDKKIKRDALDYIDGKKFKEFENLIV